MIENNPNTLEEIIEVVTAFKEGKNIEVITLRLEDTWGSCGSMPLWNFLGYRYRIAKEPRKCWVKWRDDGTVRCEPYCKGTASSDEVYAAKNDWQLVVEEVK